MSTLDDIGNSLYTGLGNFFTGGQTGLNQNLQALAQITSDPNFQSNPASFLPQLVANPSKASQDIAKTIITQHLNLQNIQNLQAIGNGSSGNGATIPSNVGGITNPSTLTSDNDSLQNPPLNPDPAMNMTPIPPGGPNPSVQYQTQLPQSALAQIPTSQARSGQNPMQAQAPALSGLDQAIAAAAQNADNQERLHTVTQGIVGNPTSAKTQLDILLKQKQAQQDLQTNAAKIGQEKDLKPLPAQEAGIIAAQQDALKSIDSLRQNMMNSDGTLDKTTLLMATPGVGVPFTEATLGIPAIGAKGNNAQSAVYQLADSMVKTSGGRMTPSAAIEAIKKQLPSPTDTPASANAKLDKLQDFFQTSTKLAGKPAMGGNGAPSISKEAAIAELKRRGVGGY